MEKEKKNYVAPQVEVAEVKVEKCFASSLFGIDGWDEDFA